MLLVSITSAIAANLPGVPKEDSLQWMKFTWVGDTLAGQYFERAAIFLPVKIQNMPHEFTLQFDLGANESLVYKPSIKPYLTLYPSVAQALDSTSESAYLRHVDVTIDDQKFEDRSLFLREDNRNPLTIDSAKSNTVKHIGTIGVDLFQDQVLIIDYPNTRLAVTDRIPEEFADAGVFVNITLDRHGRVHVPMQIDGNTEEILFDTGSSLFPFFTTPENWAAATSQQVTDSIYTSTWGEYYYTYGAPIDDIYLGDEKLPPATCYENEYLANFIKEEGIWGVTGNAYFWNGIVIIDFTHQRFGWIK